MSKSDSGHAAANEINRGYLAHIRLWSAKTLSKPSFVKILLHDDTIRVLLLPFLIAAGLFMGLYLRVLLVVRSRKLSPLHAEALSHVDAFVEQYPLHLYPIVAKALELAYLKNRLTRLVDGTVKVVEVAVGEGTLSARL